MTGGADAEMGRENIGPVLNRMTVRAGFGIGLTQVGQGVDQDGVVNRSTSRTVIVSGKV